MKNMDNGNLGVILCAFAVSCIENWSQCLPGIDNNSVAFAMMYKRKWKGT
jgi:hypothetical protein